MGQSKKTFVSKCIYKTLGAPRLQQVMVPRLNFIYYQYFF